jgi:hypothetical protein
VQSQLEDALAAAAASSTAAAGGEAAAAAAAAASVARRLKPPPFTDGLPKKDDAGTLEDAIIEEGRAQSELAHCLKVYEAAYQATPEEASDASVEELAQAEAALKLARAAMERAKWKRIAREKEAEAGRWQEQWEQLHDEQQQQQQQQHQHQHQSSGRLYPGNRSEERSAGIADDDQHSFGQLASGSCEAKAEEGHPSSSSLGSRTAATWTDAEDDDDADSAGAGAGVGVGVGVGAGVGVGSTLTTNAVSNTGADPL